jgi:hypothetical protein
MPLRSNDCYFLFLDPSKTACEFAQRRMDKKVYTEWHQGRLLWQQKVPASWPCVGLVSDTKHYKRVHTDPRVFPSAYQGPHAR